MVLVDFFVPTNKNCLKKNFWLWWGLFFVPQFQRSNKGGFFGFIYLNSSEIYFCWNVPTGF